MSVNKNAYPSVDSRILGSVLFKIQGLRLALGLYGIHWLCKCKDALRSTFFSFKFHPFDTMFVYGR